MKEFRPLRADEIEVRIGTISQRGVTLLFYKDARCDQNILDETVGPMNWQRHHSRENANCIVSIWDEDKKQWVEKEDTGTESYTEKEKGLASDSFKRACFNWGIGRELYTAPRTFVGCKTKKKETGRGYELENDWQFYGAYVSNIEYSGRKISAVTVCNQDGGVIFDWNSLEEAGVELATKMEKKIFVDYCERLGQKYAEIGKQAGATDFKTMTKEQHGKAMRILADIEKNRVTA